MCEYVCEWVGARVLHVTCIPYVRVCVVVVVVVVSFSHFMLVYIVEPRVFMAPC